MMSTSPSISLDQPLWQRVQKGDVRAFRELYERHQATLLAYLASRCRGTLDRNDLAQNIWLKVWSKRDSFNGEHFRGWLFEIARNHLADTYRGVSRERTVGFSENQEPVAIPAGPETGESEQVVALRECLEQVGGEFISVLRARIDGVSTAEIAQRMSISEAAVYTRAHRGKQELQNCVEGKLS